ncbi:MAG TPA: hypothetical protein VKR60_14885 [Candidatus Sulfotelmatobacter sp.]|nr:hypothetical protein [Candidatus Sulfotelmatobacter sp.]
MYSWENPDDRIAILQLNSELRQAQLELISAHCATHQLRLRFSQDDLARFGDAEILRKSVEAAGALNEYYSSLERRMPAAKSTVPAPKLTEPQLVEAATCVSSYLREQRDHYAAVASPLNAHQKAAMWPYFTEALLDQVRVVELKGARVPTPAFYEKAKALGFENLPQVTHMDSLTFLDVIVFNEIITGRALFHGLVHAVQFQVLGLERYCDLFVRCFANTKFHFTVPLEAHAFSLESRFARPAAGRFSVEEQVRLWVKQNRY